MRKVGIFLISSFIFIFLCAVSFVCAEESISIVTYYPSPYGSYNQLYVADKLGIGTTGASDKLHIYSSETDSDTTAGLILGRDIVTARGALLQKNAASPFNFDFSWSMHPTAEAGDLNFYSSQDSGALVTFKSTGNVGIGTTNPVTKLSILGTAGYGNLEFSNNWAGGTYIQSYDRATSAYKPISLIGGSGGSYNYILLNNTGLGIGTTNPAAKLDVIGDISASGNLIVQDQCFKKMYLCRTYNHSAGDHMTTMCSVPCGSSGCLTPSEHVLEYTWAVLGPC